KAQGRCHLSSAADPQLTVIQLLPTFARWSLAPGGIRGSTRRNGHFEGRPPPVPALGRSGFATDLSLHGMRDGPVQWRQRNPRARQYRRSARPCSSVAVGVELSLVTALGEPAADDPGDLRSWVPPVLFQHQGQLLANELRP